MVINFFSISFDATSAVETEALNNLRVHRWQIRYSDPFRLKINLKLLTSGQNCNAEDTDKHSALRGIRNRSAENCVMEEVSLYRTSVWGEDGWPMKKCGT